MTKTLKNTLKPYLLFQGMAWPDPRYAAELDWRLRHSEKSITRNDHLVLASITTAYVELLDLPQRHRNRRISQIKKALALPSDGPAPASKEKP